jgi:RimJ/RimL family protein N-acetyltransferase
MDFSGSECRTPRLVLRPYRDDDFDVFADMHAREDVARYLLWPPRDEEASRRAFARHATVRLDQDGDGVTLSARRSDTGAFVGEFVLFLRTVEHRGGEVGYILHPDAAGQGLATEGAAAMLTLAFETLGLHRVIGRIDARNTASARVLIKLGMRQEAHFRRNELVKGEWTDEIVFAVLADEWSSRSSPTAAIWSGITGAPAWAS